MIHQLIVPPITLVFSSLILHFSTGKIFTSGRSRRSISAELPSVRHEIVGDKCSDFNPNLIQDYKPVAHLE